MQIKLNQFSRRQHVFVFLTASGLFVAQLQRRFAGWVCLHSANLTLAEASQDFSEIYAKLKDATAEWGIPSGTWASWIMPGDVLAVLQYCKLKDQVIDISSLFPFERSDIHISDFKENSEKQQSIYWIHKDWLSEVVKVSAQLAWVCDEIYARAQLFTPILPRGGDKHRVLLEGDGSESHLHIYSPGGVVVRTTKVDATRPDLVASAIRREMAALSAEARGGFRLFVFNVPTQATGLMPDEAAVEQLEGLGRDGLTIQLIGSTQTGIEVNPSFGALLNRINAYSLVFAIVASLLLAAMVWHDGVLQSEVDNNRRLVRKETPRYQAAKLVRLETLKMAEAVKVKASIVAEPPVFQPLAEILTVLGPPASVSSYERTATGVRVAGVNGDSKAIKVLFEKNPKFSGVKIVPLPDSLKGKAGVFAMEMQWSESVAPVKADDIQKGVK